MELRRVFANAIRAAFATVDADVALVPCAQARFGDYQCNNAMAIFAELKKQGGEGVPKNPRAVAEAVVAKLNTDGAGLIESTSCVLRALPRAAPAVVVLLQSGRKSPHCGSCASCGSA